MHHNGFVFDRERSGDAGCHIDFLRDRNALRPESPSPEIEVRTGEPCRRLIGTAGIPHDVMHRNRTVGSVVRDDQDGVHVVKPCRRELIARH